VDVPLWAWPAFVAVILVLLAVDLVAHRRAHVVSMREAGVWSAVWVLLGLGFAGILWVWQGATAAGQYLAGFLIEKDPGRRQHLRLRPAVHLLRRPPPVPAPGAVPRRARRAGVPRRLHRRRRQPAGDLPRHHLRLRRLPGADGHQDGPLPRPRGPPRAQPGPAAGPPRLADDRPVPRPALLGAPRWPVGGHPAVRGSGRGGDHRRHLRRGLHPGHLRRHQRAVPGLHLQRLRHPWPAGPVLPARGHDPPLRLPQAGPIGGAGLRRGQDAGQRLLQGGHLGLARGHRRHHRGQRLGLAAAQGRWRSGKGPDRSGSGAQPRDMGRRPTPRPRRPRPPEHRQRPHRRCETTSY